MTLTDRLREKTSGAFHKHGLLCASYPIPIILFTGLCVLACCYPLLKLPLPGTGPVEYTTLAKDYAPPPAFPAHQQGEPSERPDWYTGAPVAYIQQVLVKATVSPWPTTFLAVDVFRSPLSRVFQLVEEIRNHALQDGSSVKSLEEICLQVTDLLPNLKKLQGLLPEHGCLLLSPGNFWQNDQERFRVDPDIIKTIHQYEPKTLQTSATPKDLLFGVPGKYSGVNLYNRKRVVTYTITLGLRRYDSRFLSSLRSRLKALHPSPNCTLREEHIVHVHFKEEIGVAELIPLVTTYIILFAYIYFSTRKIDMVKSKWGLALAAVVTVLSSLLMSVGLCTLFGLTPTLNGGEIFPYLVVVIGLENVLVLTKSVVSTPVDLEVKLRIAQGLSNESWSIMKNMATELGIILIGYFTLVPAIQEFCLFAVVGLVSDFFLQMFFFTTVLSIDIRRMELADLNKRLPAEACVAPAKPSSGSQRYERQPAMRPATLHTITLQPSSFRNLRLPKRLRVIYFFARTRLAQRLIMTGTVVWIGILFYTDPAGLRPYLASQVTEQSPLGESGLPALPVPVPGEVLPTGGDAKLSLAIFPPDPVQQLSGNQTLESLGRQEAGLRAEEEEEEAQQRQRRTGSRQTQLDPKAEVTWGAEDEELWRRLSFRHWPSLFSYYNLTLAKRSPTNAKRKNAAQYMRISSSTVDLNSSLEEASGKTSSSSSEQSANKSFCSDTESLGGSTECQFLDSANSSPGHKKLLKAPSTGTVSSSEDCEDRDLIQAYDNDLSDVSENGLPHGLLKNIKLSSAAQTHRLRKLRGPSKCRECENFVVSGLECEECLLACHKKCLENLLINCGHQKLPARASLFGIDFIQVPRDFSEEVPFIVVKCTSEIEARALGVQGIYRISGSKARVERLCQAFENGRGLVELSDHSPHDITGVLKHFLKELTSPVLPFKLYDAFITLSKSLQRTEDRSGDDSETAANPIKSTKDLLSKLPATNYNTLRHLIAHLYRVAERNEENKMSPNNLGIIFGPTLIRPPFSNDVSMTCLLDSGYQSQLVEFLILNYERIFGMDDLPSTGLCERENSLKEGNANDALSSSERDLDVSSEKNSSKLYLDEEEDVAEDRSNTADRQEESKEETHCSENRDTVDLNSRDNTELKDSLLEPDPEIGPQSRGRFSRVPVKHPRAIIPKAATLPLPTASLSSSEAGEARRRSASPDPRGKCKRFEITPETARIVSKFQPLQSSPDCYPAELEVSLQGKLGDSLVGSQAEF